MKQYTHFEANDELSALIGTTPPCSQLCCLPTLDEVMCIMRDLDQGTASALPIVSSVSVLEH
ncbi:hypothetical protein BLOT_009251 [Blomia tropicalis]|nr:hypothetical protein BLOT_009251 [Blomia tropicalis]